jgi:glucose/arabinose dehydrogenase
MMKPFFIILGFAILLGLSACQFQPKPQVASSSLQLETSRIIGGTLGGVIPPAASVEVEVKVPESLTAYPFDTPRRLVVPPDFEISVYARLESPRFMTIAPNGDLLVSQPFKDPERRYLGNIILYRPTESGIPEQYTFASNLKRAHDMVFHTIDDITYFYYSETNQVTRCIYSLGDTSVHDCDVVVSDLIDDDSPELNGALGHELKNIALDSQHKLYVSIASFCNACTEDTQSDPLRGAIYVYDADGSNGRLFAQGLRNATGLAFRPETDRLWVTVTNRDNIAYPYNNDFDEDGTNDYGKIIPEYVDNHPPELLTSVRDGGNYGWPFCNPNPDSETGYDRMPLDNDVILNPNGEALDCDTVIRSRKGIQAHSTPLGLLFLHETKFPEAYQKGLAIAYRGSWNRTKKTGYKIAYFPWNIEVPGPGEQMDLVTGWLNDETQEAWGRPVDVAVDLEGNMFISDDTSGTIYKMSYTGNTDIDAEE